MEVYMKKWKIWMICCLVFALAAHAVALAETGRGDLSERFGSEPSIEYLGETYRVKNRMSSLLFAISEAGEIRLMMIVAVDDDTCRTYPVRLKPNSALHGEAVGLAYAQNLPTQDEKYIALLAAVNELFPHAVVAHYVGLDAAGLDLLDGGMDDANPDREAALWERLKSILRTSNAASSEDLAHWMDMLSPYTCTDLSSGGLMRIADKVERYERMPAVQFEGAVEIAEGGAELLRLNAERMLPAVVECFYEKAFW